MNNPGINLHGGAPVYSGSNFGQHGGSVQVTALILQVAAQMSYGSPQYSSQGSGFVGAGGVFAGAAGYLGRVGYGFEHQGHAGLAGISGFGGQVSAFGAGGFGASGYAGGNAMALMRAHMHHPRVESNKMWDVWFDYADGKEAKRRSPIVLDLNHNGRPDITGKNITGDGRIDGPTTLFDLDPSKASYEFKSRARRPGRGAPKVEGGHWAGSQYLDKDNNVVGELRGNDYYWGNRDPREKTEWLAKNGGDGMLVWDVNRDGQITSSKELFGNYDIDGKERFQNGYDKLAHYFDRNRDGQVHGAELQGLSIWKDTNADGKVDAGEMLSLESQGIHNFDVRNYNREDMSSTYGTVGYGVPGYPPGGFGIEQGQFRQPQNFQQLQSQIQMLLAFIMQFSFQAGDCQCRGGILPQQPPQPQVETTTGDPKTWYFQHHQYKTEKTDYGHIQTQGDVRIEYNEEAQTGHIYKKVDGQWQLTEVRKEWGGKAASPVMLDMDGSGTADVASGEWKPHAGKGDIGAHKVRFDLDGDGHKELSEWTGGKDGLLLKLNDQQVQEYQRDGRLEVSGKELYGDEGGKYQDGYAKMRALSDADSDGKLSGDELKNHYVWQDTDRDGVVDKGELKTAQNAGITSVKATHDGNFQSAFEINGEQRKTWDWWPTTWQ